MVKNKNQQDENQTIMMRNLKKIESVSYSIRTRLGGLDETI